MSTQLTQFLPTSEKSKTKQIDLSVTGMTCSSCVNSLETSLNKIPGVRASINLAMESAHIIAPMDMKESQLIAAVKSAGYEAKLFKGEDESFARSNKLGVRLLLTFFLTIPVILLAMADSVNTNIKRSIDENALILIDNLNKFLANQNITLTFDYPAAPMSAWLVLLLSVPVVLILAWPIHRAAIKNISRPTMDTLVSIGSLTALIWSIYATATYSMSDAEIFWDARNG